MNGFKYAVDRQFSLFRWAIGGLYVLLGVLISGGLGLYQQVSALRTLVAQNTIAISGAKSELSTLIVERSNATKHASDALNERLIRVEDRISRANEDQKEILSGLRDLKKTIAPEAPTILALSKDEQDAVRGFFNLEGASTKIPVKYGIGALVKDTLPIPEELVRKAPALKGYNYARDPSGYILIVDRSDRVISIVGPA